MHALCHELCYFDGTISCCLCMLIMMQLITLTRLLIQKTKKIRKKNLPLLPLHSCSCMCTHAHTHARAHTNTHTHTHRWMCFWSWTSLFSDVWHIYLPYLYSFISFIGVLLLLCKYHISFIGVLLLLYKYHIPFIGVLVCVTFLSSVFYSVSLSHCFHQCFTLCHISFISVLLSITLLSSVFYFSSVLHFFHQCFTLYHTACLCLLLFLYWSCIYAVLWFLSVYVSTNHLCVQPYSMRQKPECRKCGQQVQCKHSSFHKVDESVSPYVIHF